MKMYSYAEKSVSQGMLLLQGSFLAADKIHLKVLFSCNSHAFCGANTLTAISIGISVLCFLRIVFPMNIYRAVSVIVY